MRFARLLFDSLSVSLLDRCGASAARSDRLGFMTRYGIDLGVSGVLHGCVEANKIGMEMIATSFFFLQMQITSLFPLPFLSKGGSRTFFWEFSDLSQMLSDIFGTGNAEMDDSSIFQHRDNFEQISSHQPYETSAPTRH